MFDKRVVPSQITPLTIAYRRTGSPSIRFLMADKLETPISSCLSFKKRPSRWRRTANVRHAADALPPSMPAC